jgi:class 3 adenylate cyclase
VRDLGLDVREGLHTDECEVVGEKLGGLAVKIGRGWPRAPAPGEVLVTSTLKDLAVGSVIEFQDRAVAELKGIPGEWRLFAVESV